MSISRSRARHKRHIRIRRLAPLFNTGTVAAIRTGDPTAFTRVKNGIHQFWNQDTQKYHELAVRGAANEEYVIWGPGDSSAMDTDADMTTTPANGGYRIMDSIYESYNPDQTGFHPIYLFGGVGAMYLAVGAKDVRASQANVSINTLSNTDFRWNGSKVWQFWNYTTEKFHGLLLRGSENEVTVNFGVGET